MLEMDFGDVVACTSNSNVTCDYVAKAGSERHECRADPGVNFRLMH